MLIRFCFAIIVMVDTIYYAVSRSLLKFLLALVLFVMFSCNTLISINHAMFFQAQVWGGVHEKFISASSCALYIYVRHLFLVD